MSKFKHGDKVVLVEDWIPYGTKGVVIESYEARNGKRDYNIHVDFDYCIFEESGPADWGKTWTTEDSLEFADIFDTPLWNALK